jgi:hypothetical protein
MEKGTQSKTNEESQTISSDYQYPSGVLLIKNIYIFLLIAVPLLIFVNAISDETSLGISTLLKSIFLFLIYVNIYFGIQKIKSWVVVLVLVCSYFGVVDTLLSFFSIQANTGDIADRLFHILLFCFYSYQIIIFSKKETRKFFRESGTTII